MTDITEMNAQSNDEYTMTFEEFKATARDSHVAQEDPHNSAAYQNAEAMSWDGAIRVYANGSVILCKLGDDTYFFDDYKERFTGTLDEMERALYEFDKNG